MNAAALPEATRKMLAPLWERNLPVVRSRVDELGQAALAAEAGTLTAQARSSAEGTAHKLAGSLGMFGYKRGTDVAREFEHALQGEQALDGQRLESLAQELRSELNL